MKKRKKIQLVVLFSVQGIPVGDVDDNFFTRNDTPLSKLLVWWVVFLWNLVMLMMMTYHHQHHEVSQEDNSLDKESLSMVCVVCSKINSLPCRRQEFLELMTVIIINNKSNINFWEYELFKNSNHFIEKRRKGLTYMVLVSTWWLERSNIFL